MIVTYLPAAGRSTRMRGADKLLQEIEGVPLLRRMAARALAADLGPVLVGLRPADTARRTALDGLDLGLVDVSDADEGLAATLRAGADAAGALIGAASPEGGDYEYSGMLILLPDMPEIETDDLVRFGEAFQARGGPILRAVTKDGQPGHPVLFPDFVLKDFDILEGDRGAASILDAHRLETVALPGTRALTDLDTPEDWERWRKRPLSH